MVFNSYSKPIGEAYADFIERYFCNRSNRTKHLLYLYKKYAVLDSNFPRPILTFLGVNAESNELQDIASFKDKQLLYIPQLVRDFLAIHDDIIDEDLVKFNSDSLPYAFSKINDIDSSAMNKWGKDIALLLADMQLSAPLKIISSLSVDAEKKQQLIDLVSEILYTTNAGQLDELLLNDVPLHDITTDEIITLYKNKAADYCYAFPITIGMVYSGYDKQYINETRSIMLNFGFYSQIINDLEGIFFEKFSNERNTLSDIELLRRTYLLVKFYHKTDIPQIKSLLNLHSLSEKQALLIKEEMQSSGMISDIKFEIKEACIKLQDDIEKLKVGTVLRNYLKGLINSRILDNINKL